MCFPSSFCCNWKHMWHIIVVKWNEEGAASSAHTESIRAVEIPNDTASRRGRGEHMTTFQNKWHDKWNAIPEASVSFDFLGNALLWPGARGNEDELVHDNDSYYARNYRNACTTFNTCQWWWLSFTFCWEFRLLMKPAGHTSIAENINGGDDPTKNDRKIQILRIVLCGIALYYKVYARRVYFIQQISVNCIWQKSVSNLLN